MALRKSEKHESVLIEAARKVRDKAYARYSGYRVGAAIEDDEGNIHIGCNVENAAFPEGSCAEANAIGAMIAAGGKTIRAIAVAGGRDTTEACTPCGGCRQRIREFSTPDTVIILQDDDGKPQRHDIDTLLPRSFVLL
ncbi:MAG: cytidine deaminase [Woeseiaceae bacterium]|nr:cytidine deaminase [Woeseiaceae bacterium]